MDRASYPSGLAGQSDYVCWARAAHDADVIDAPLAQIHSIDMSLRRLVRLEQHSVSQSV
jgi:hypothetical protein